MKAKAYVVENYKGEQQVSFDKRLGIMPNGEDNQKPQIIENIINSSPTALLCAGMYSNFIVGGGFEFGSPSLGFKKNTWQEVNLNDLLLSLGKPLSRHGGVFIHVQYNAMYEKVSFKTIPYTLCRIGKKDSNDYAGKIVVSPNGWGRYFKKKDLKIFDAYNPNPDVIQTQVDFAGGWDNYNGQILYFKLNDEYDYANSPIETVFTSADTEYNLDLYYNSIVKKGFKDTTFIRHKEFEDSAVKREFRDSIKEATGPENANSIVLIQDDWDEDNNEGNLKFKTIPDNSKPDKYNYIEQSCSNRIRKAYKIPPQLIEATPGKLGNTSGQDLITAQATYNATTATEREALKSLFSELFRNFVIDINPANNWHIKQFRLLDDGTTN